MAQPSKQQRKLSKARIRREAALKRAEIHSISNGRELHSPRVLLGAMLLLALFGGILSQKARNVAERAAPLPHQVALNQLNVLATALGRYHFHVGEWPNDKDGLIALLNRPTYSAVSNRWDGPYINQLISDPWGTPYSYTNSFAELPSQFSLTSAGPDKTLGTPDDLHPAQESFDPGTEWTNGWVRAVDRLPGVRYLLDEPPTNEPPSAE